MATSGRSVFRDAVYQSASDEAVLPALLGTQGEIWLAVRTDGKAGAGTRSDPFDASTATKYTTLLTTYSSNYVFMYYPDEYLTLGWEFGVRKTANTGCKHYAPFGKAVIKLASLGTGASVGTAFGCSYNERADGFEIDGLEINCDATNQPKWAAGGARFVSGIVCSGSNIKIRNTKVINFGTNSVGTENFPFFLGNNLDAGVFENNLIEYCTVTSPVAGNQDGISAMTMGVFATGQTTKNNAIRNCTIDMYGNDALYSHGPYALLVENNYVRGCVNGFYTEPLSTYFESPIIRANKYVQGTYGVNGSAHVGGIVKSITIEDNAFIDCTAAVALASDDDLLTHYPSVAIRGNRFVKSDGSVGSGANVIYVTSATSAVITDNILDANATPVVLVKATNATVAENRRIDGTLVDYQLNTVATTQKAWLASTSGGDASTNTSTSVDSEIVAFSGTGGKTLKRLNTLTGVPKLTAGVVSIATLGTDYLSNASSLPAANLTGTIATARLGSGTADATTVLLGNQTWGTAASGTLASTALVLKGDGAGNAIAATLGTDYLSSASNLNGSNVASGTVANARLTTAVQRLVAAASDLAAGTAIDWSVSTMFYKTLSANTTFTFSNDTDGYSIMVKILNTASNYSVTWPAGIKWKDGAAPTQSLGAVSDLYGFAKFGSVIVGVRGGQNQS